MWAAKQGLAALAVRWDDGPNATVSTADVVRGLDEASQQPGVVARRQGDAAGALAGAAQRIDQVYQVPFLAHATMEPMNCTVHVRKDSCEVWTGSQTLTRAQATAARAPGRPHSRTGSIPTGWTARCTSSTTSRRFRSSTSGMRSRCSTRPFGGALDPPTTSS